MSDARELFKKWRSLSVVDLQVELQELVKQQFRLKMQHAIGELKATHHITKVRKDIARILGLLTEKTK